MRFFLALLFIAFSLHAADNGGIQPGSRGQFDVITYSLGCVGAAALAYFMRKQAPTSKRWILFAALALLNAVMLAVTLLA